MIVANRRSFLAGLVSACAAPAIVTSSGFRSGLWLPPVREWWLATHDYTTDTWHVRVDYMKNWPDLVGDLGDRDRCSRLGVWTVPDEARHALERAFGLGIAEARRRVQLARGPAFCGCDMRLSGFKPLLLPNGDEVRVRDLLEVAPLLLLV